MRRRLDMWRRMERHQLRKELAVVWRLSAFMFVAVYLAGVLTNNPIMFGVGLVGAITYPVARFLLLR